MKSEFELSHILFRIQSMTLKNEIKFKRRKIQIIMEWWFRDNVTGFQSQSHYRSFMFSLLCRLMVKCHCQKTRNWFCLLKNTSSLANVTTVYFFQSQRKEKKFWFIVFNNNLFSNWWTSRRSFVNIDSHRIIWFF